MERVKALFGKFAAIHRIKLWRDSDVEFALECDQSSCLFYDAYICIVLIYQAKGQGALCYSHTVK